MGFTVVQKTKQIFNIKEGDIIMEINKIYNEDCITYMSKLEDNVFDLTLTDIPYGEVNRDSNGLRTLSKEQIELQKVQLLYFVEKSNSARYINSSLKSKRKTKARLDSLFGKNQIHLQ